MPTLAEVGAELDRARAYLEILRIRMGERLAVQVQVAPVSAAGKLSVTVAPVTAVGPALLATIV